MSWWSAPGEIDALQALLRVHRNRYPDVEIANSAMGDNPVDELHARFAAADPPDTFQADAFALDEFSELSGLDGLLDEEGASSALFTAVRPTITRDGEVRAIPIGLHRENGMFYNTRIFDLIGMDPPTNYGELMAVCSAIHANPTLQAAGVHPIAASWHGWVTRILFLSLAALQAGTQDFHQYFVVHGPTPNHAVLRSAVDALVEVFANCVHPDYADRGVGWEEAARMIMDDPGRTNATAAMFFHGDWVKGLYQALGWHGFQVAEAGDGLFLFGADCFPMPAAAPHPTEARDFLRTAISPEGQLAFNLLKGSTPARTDITPAQFGSDQVALSTYNDLQNATVAAGVPAWAASETVSDILVDWLLGATPNCGQEQCCTAADVSGGVCEQANVCTAADVAQQVPGCTAEADPRVNEIVTADDLYDALRAEYPE